MIYVASLFLLLLTGCDWFTKEKREEPTEAAETPALFVINVLDKQQYDNAHLKGSVNVPLTELDKFMGELIEKGQQDIPLVFYCSNYMCTGSGAAAKQFMEKGFKNVFAYEGGTAEWYQLSKNDPTYAIEGPATDHYLEIVIKKPAQHDAQIRVIEAAELKKMMKEANLL